jgi:DNA repair exonuclease SbcCD ATPase subunit
MANNFVDGFVNGALAQQRQNELLDEIRHSNANSKYVSGLEAANKAAEILLLSRNFESQNQSRQIIELKKIITDLHNFFLKYDASVKECLSDHDKLLDHRKKQIEQRDRLVEALLQKTTYLEKRNEILEESDHLLGRLNNENKALQAKYATLLKRLEQLQSPAPKSASAPLLTDPASSSAAKFSNTDVAKSSDGSGTVKP